MRPRPVVLFERIAVAAILIGLLADLLEWDQTVAVAAMFFARPVVVVLVMIGLGLVINLPLILTVSRRRSRFALWTGVVFLAFALLMALFHPTAGQPIIERVGAGISLLAQAVAYGFLFTPEARRWMRREPQRASMV